MPLDTLLINLEGFLHAEKDWVQCTSDSATRQRLEAARSEALRKLGDELESYRAGLASGRLFRRLLVAVDQSQPATWAVDAAVQLAYEVGGKVGLVHVTEADIGFTPEFGFSESNLVIERRREAEEILKRAEAGIPEALRAGTISKEGDPMQQIVAAAKEWNADVIVIGTHGRGPVAHFLLGSTAEAVVRHAHCPVLTVGHNASITSPKQCSCASGKCCDGSKGQVRADTAVVSVK